VAVIALVALPTSAVLVVLAPEVVRVALGPRWLEAITPFQILAAGTLFRTSYKMSDTLARSTGVVYRRARRQIIYAACVIGGAYVGQRWGMIGVAIGVLGALTVNFLLMAQLSLTVCRSSWKTFWAAHRPSVPLAAAAGTVAWAVASVLRHWAVPPLAILILAGCAAAGSAVCLIWRYPQQCLGSDGVWMWDAMTSFISRTRGRTREAVVAPARAGV
jgi:PST family polysaccharide transporter